MKSRRGRPATGTALTAAERMRRYRIRLRERGLRATSRVEPSRELAAFRLPAGLLLSPGEHDVLRRFCAALAQLPAMPTRIAVFGSRARGSSGERSDLDLAVFVDAPRSVDMERAVARISVAAQAPYREGAYGIYLNPVVIFADEPPGFARVIDKDLATIWTRSS